MSNLKPNQKVENPSWQATCDIVGYIVRELRKAKNKREAEFLIKRLSHVSGYLSYKAKIENINK